MESAGWLLDLYPDTQEGVILWVVTQTGKRLCLRQPFVVTFSVAGPSPHLRRVWRWLQKQPIPVVLGRSQGRDLFLSDPVTLLTIQVDASQQMRLFSRLSAAFPDLDYYDADVQIALRHAATFGTFPMARCVFEYTPENVVTSLRVLDCAWDLDPLPAPLRVLMLEPDQDPQHSEPRSLLLYNDKDLSLELPLERPEEVLQTLAGVLNDYDPDVLITSYGDTWMLPLLMEQSQKLGIDLPLNRDEAHGAMHKKERSYFSYGHIVYNGQQVHLAGRLHLDKRNSFLLADNGLEGVLESARVTALPIQTAARTSPGTGISSMQILTAMRNNILVPWHKQQVEGTKTASELIRYDQGGLVYQPLIGLHSDVAEIDFVSMYPSIMVRCNISPEKPRPTYLGSDEEPGLIPLTLQPLLEKRVAIKVAVGQMARSDPRYKRYQAASSAYKWLLVTCVGYLGYKKARFGRIESHESVTTWGREALLLAKETAEDMGYTVLHMYVDALWVQQEGVSRPDQLEPLLDAIAERPGLSIALDGIYRWVAFLPSKGDDRVSVPNRYFGVFQDGSLKYRGIEARRHDMPEYVVDTQLDMVRLLCSARSRSQLDFAIYQAQHLLQQRIADLYHGRVPLRQLVMGQHLSRELDAYKSPSPAARALMQLHEVGKDKRPGQRVRFIYVHSGSGVHAWDAPTPPSPEEVNAREDKKRLVRAAEPRMEPFGVGVEEESIKLRDFFEMEVK